MRKAGTQTEVYARFLRILNFKSEISDLKSQIDNWAISQLEIKIGGTKCFKTCDLACEYY
jgi:hypothetical protein